MFQMDELQKSLTSGMELQVKIEDVVLEDLAVVAESKKQDIRVPEGFEKIDVDLNESAGGHYIYLCTKYGTNQERAINDICFVVGKNAAAPAGYEKIDVDLNKKAGGKYIYLCFRRGKEKPIRDIKIISSKSKENKGPEGYTFISQDLNESAGGKYIYLCYKN